MEYKIKLIILLLGILFTGLTAGLCFNWSNTVTSGIGRLDDLTFLQSFQAMNRAIINPSFLIVFFSPVIFLSVNAFLHKNANPTTFWSFLLAAILFFAGVGLITIFKNVPLNEILDKTILENLSAIELAELRTKFEQPWNRWHIQRTITSFISFALLLIGIIFTK
ncbi:anthrone oxygenase family protein [Aquimarina algiphila]|uniref:anthrone oxygenase family protein n=1 Tax=Aquimarina algiphila TaxID=2047982 RepID=UPI0023308D10|nr:anthrone oxygenase family protein [Aquimarina algiphila]